VLPNGVPINGPVELRAQLADRPATFVTALTEKLMMYALGRQLEYFDMPQVRAVVRGSAKDNYKLSSIVLGIVNTNAFRKQGAAVISKTGTPAGDTITLQKPAPNGCPTADARGVARVPGCAEPRVSGR
jgi:hypothetical protein